MTRYLPVAAIAAALSFGFGGVASAAVYDINFDQCSCGLSDYGTITVTPDGVTDTLHVVVALNSTTFFNQAGGGLDALAFSLSGSPAITLSGLPSNFGTNGAQSAGTHHEDGLGDWGYIVTWVGPPTNNGTLGVHDLAFDITSLSNLALTSNLISGQNIFFSVDIIQGGNTGVVGATLSAVPEPATWALMIAGIGMVGAGLRLRRKEGLQFV